jgi:hypothetical protein
MKNDFVIWIVIGLVGWAFYVVAEFARGLGG